MEPRAKEYFLVINKQRKHTVDSGKLRGFLASLVPELGVERRAFSIVFVTDEKIRSFNRAYRGFDKATDVLSFRGDRGDLGDIPISSETAYNQTPQPRPPSFEMNVRRRHRPGP